MDPSGPGLRGRAGVDKVLAHFGVKGMKWGVVRKSTSSGPTSADAKKAIKVNTVVRKSGTKAVSNKDLQAAIQRMNLEKQYRELSPTGKQRVAKFVGGFLLDIGKSQAKQLATQAAAKGVKVAIAAATKK